MSGASSQAISIHTSDPLWKSGRSAYLKTISGEVETYSDVTVAIGGYDAATFTINDSPIRIEGWIESGLGRHIETYSPSLVKRWAGFVNEIQVALGPLSFTRGPLLDVANKVKGRYNDFLTGKPDVTSVASDTDSQALFGIGENILAEGRVSSTTADAIRDTYLAENKYPESSQTLGEPGGPTLTVNCLGYYHLLDYPYNETGVATTATYTLREKLIDVIAADPNSIFSSDTTQLVANTQSVFEYEDEDKLAFDLIKELVAMGPASGNDRMLFGIYADRVPYYTQIPSSILYQQRLSDVGVNLKTLSGQAVDPWDVRVGEWIQFTDFLVGRNLPSTSFREDPRVMFIESMTLTIPYTGQITGGKTETLPQQLAKLGLSGIS